MELYKYIPGTVPVILSIPHTGTYVPNDLLQRFRAPAKQLPDTDWHLEALYSFAKEMGIHVLVATHSRYVIDLNRPPTGQSLYPGKFTTALCPTTLFDGNPIYQKGMEPTEEEIQNRITRYWLPYHNKLRSLIHELKTKGRVILFDAHSIRSQVPTLFEGILPSINLGTADGQSANKALVDKVAAYCQNTAYSTALNGRFKGGYITRHYGNPVENIEAIQLEFTQLNYMAESFPFTYDIEKAKACQIMLSELLSLLIAEIQK
ncbi:N-formylglutamate deformylase [Legionella micdadei]|uniref:N-formylglutamate deformylase n=1 Tax=Legionella micdadei TaxID=451 RepID=A0A098GBF5_LEGMI|nr:N-formylglutamate deformylase [Legionella micdadei]ARG98496.1 N-formylglutamate deformylase [Legionella micdadei]ARH01239.1 N-formylglutamate deformylase [Legionella micdadei]KTD30293.1 N-formylglutamate amidohydrolase [Legionella micdadei]NSL18433.1 N-formylglutamate deformylase [Legionella micdadei]CEG59814.1 N-formylglutamate deformylase [Legionella micdadei]